MYKQARVNNLIKQAMLGSFVDDAMSVYSGTAPAYKSDPHMPFVRTSRSLARQLQKKKKGYRYDPLMFPNGQAKPTSAFGKALAYVRYGKHWNALPGWKGGDTLEQRLNRIK